MGSFNFQKLPEKAPSNNLEAGYTNLTIKDVEVKVAESSGNTMLVVKNNADGHSNLDLLDHYSMETPKGEPVMYGEYKLRKLMIATNTIPDGDFTLPIIARMLKGKRYRAELVEQESGEKTYINIGKPETFSPTEEDMENLSPADLEVKPGKLEPTTVKIEDDEEI